MSYGKSYNFRLYDPERKNRFLNEKYPNDLTKATYTSLLKAVGKFERDKNKDVCDFSYAEATELLIGLGKKTFRSIDVAHTIILKYGDWCLEEKYNNTGVNIFKLFTKDDLKQYINQVAQKNSYITRDEMYDYCSQLYNYIDKAMLALLFEGVRGRSDINHSFEELKNLKMTDIYPDSNMIIVTRDSDENQQSQKRAISVGPRTMDILVAACREDVYHKSNGEAKGRFAIMPIKNSPYLIRTIEKLNTTNEDDRIAVGNICSRFKNFRKYTGIKYLTPTLIFQSGMLYRCLKMEEEIGEELKPENFRQLYRDLQLDERNWSGLKEMYKNYKQNKSIVLE